MAGLRLTTVFRSFRTLRTITDIVVTWTNFQVSDGLGGFEDFLVSDGAGGSETFTVIE